MLSNISFVTDSGTKFMRRLHEHPFVMTALIDVDDFVLFRTTWGSHRARRELVSLEGRIAAALYDIGGSERATVVSMEPDAWIVSFHGSDLDELSALAISFSKRLQEVHMSGSPMSVTIGLGCASAAPAGLETSLERAQEALERKLVEGGARVFASPAPSDLPFPINAVATLRDSLRSQLMQCARQRDKAAISQIAQDWLDSAAGLEGITPNGIRELTSSVLLSLSAELSPTVGQRTTWQENTDSGLLQTVTSISEIHDRSYLLIWIEGYIEDLISSLPPLKAISPVLALVDNHLKENYTSPSISLESVARAIHASPYHISHLYQKERGTTFLRSLTNLRIAHARELLETTESPIDAISIAVGYNSTSRFRINFKHVVGVTPRDYRLLAVDGGSSLISVTAAER